MQTNEAKSILDNCFNNEFNEENFKKLIIGFLGNIDENKKIEISGAYIPDSFKEYVKSYKRIGQYTDKNDIKIDILAVKLKKETSIDRARTMQRNFIAEYLKKRGEKEAAIVAYYTEEIEDWRFSFVKMDYNLIQDEKGILKIREEKTPAKRFSFLVGSNEPNHTAKKQLLPYIENNNKNISIQEIENIFDIESINKEFFEKYKKLFELLNKELERITINNSSIKKEFESKNINIENFSKKLLGQVVFLYFLQKKGWLGVGKDETGHFKNWNEGRKDFLRALFEKEIINYNNFFNDVLEPLFYEALATERDNDYYSPFNCKIPFLNGGLFDPINNYNWQETDILIDDKVFKQIFDTFDLYNFTVKEDEPLEREVALDPEMLGVVFEKLLDKENQKAKGAFYTPREIVHYMCQESLINFIYNETENKIKREDIEKLVHLGDRVIFNEIAKENGTISYINELSETIRKNAKLIDDKLANIKVCDPAIGSGAFPVGIMIEIVKIRDVLTTYLENKEGRSLYELKRNAVENSIYGVDIEEGAVEIAKLRLWLSLVVDENDFKNIKPLPNLDYKIMCGNSLLEELVVNDTTIEIFNYEEFCKNRKNNLKSKDRKKFEKKKSEMEYMKLFLETPEIIAEDIKKLHQDFTNTTNHKEKKRLKFLIEKSEKELVLSAINIEKQKLIEKIKYGSKLDEINEIEKEINSGKPKPYFLWKWNFMDVFDEKGGFDIVIGNPPYIDSEEMSKNQKETRELYKSKFKTANGNWDIFIIFIENGYNILKNNGSISYIVPNKLIGAKYSKDLKKFMMKYQINSLRDYSNIDVFKDADVYPVVFVAEKKIIKNCSFVNTKVMNTLETFKTNFNIKNETFYADIFWDKFFTDSKIEVILLEKLLNKKRIIEYVDIKGAATVGEAYEIKKYLKNFSELKENIDYYKFINTGTIDKYSSLWNTKDTQYIKGKYFSPIIEYNNLKNISNIRLKEAQTEKIIVAGMTKEIEAYYDFGEYLAGKSTLILQNPKKTISLKYLIGILNTKLITYFFTRVFNSLSMSGGFFTIGKEQLSYIPIINLSEKQQKPFIDIVEQIMSLKSQEKDTTELENQIDEMVYDLYELTEEEKEIVRNFKN